MVAESAVLVLGYCMDRIRSGMKGLVAAVAAAVRRRRRHSCSQVATAESSQCTAVAVRSVVQAVAAQKHSKARMACPSSAGSLHPVNHRIVVVAAAAVVIPANSQGSSSCTVVEATVIETAGS